MSKTIFYGKRQEGNNATLYLFLTVSYSHEHKAQEFIKAWVSNIISHEIGSTRMMSHNQMSKHILSCNYGPQWSLIREGQEYITLLFPYTLILLCHIKYLCSVQTWLGVPMASIVLIIFASCQFNWYPKPLYHNQSILIGTEKQLITTIPWMICSPYFFTGKYYFQYHSLKLQSIWMIS